ncbi:MAG: ATP-dependent DNA helicase [archaeon]
MTKIFFEFDKPRKFQEDFMEDVWNTVKNKKNLLAHCPTGVGKTHAVLSPAITLAIKKDLTVFFLSPKISQHEIALKVVNQLNNKFNLELSAVDLVGRKQACIHDNIKKIENTAFYEFCAKKRKNHECNYYNNCYSKKETTVKKRTQLLKKLEKENFNHLKIKQSCIQTKHCPYEVSLLLAKKATVIIGDYYHLMNPTIKENLFSKIKKSLDESIIIIDEAHNLPERIRAMQSSRINLNIIEKSVRELMELSQATENKTTKNEINYALKELNELRKNIQSLSERLLKKEKECTLTQNSLRLNESEVLSNKLFELGLKFLELKEKDKCSLVQASNFLKYWKTESDSHVRIIKQAKNTLSVIVRELNASNLSGKTLNNSFASILMSGTLLPTKMFADLLGLNHETSLKEYESPFNKDNRINLIVPTVTTKFTERNEKEFEKIALEASKIVNNTPGNTAIFFPSYDLLEQVNYFFGKMTNKKVFKQEQGVNSKQTSELLENFKKQSLVGNVLMACCNGSLAEGIDYPGKDLVCAIIVGVPLAEMTLETKSLVNYYDKKFNAGWHYAYIYPAMNKAFQAAGRVIRNEKDEGIIVFMDKRYLWGAYQKCFPKNYDKMITSEPEKLVKLFWQT